MPATLTILSTTIFMEHTMKKYLLPLALVSVVALQACNQKPPASAGEAAEAPAGEAAKAPASGDLATTEQRLSYGIGVNLGQRMKADSVPLDAASFSAGVADVLSGAKTRMTEEEIATEMKAYQEKAAAEHEAAQKKLGEANVAASTAFLAENEAKKGVTTTASGLQYEVLTAGTGPKPGAEDTVEVHYRGTLVDGTEFDSSYSRGETVTFGVGQVIPGWTEALQLMPKGSKWKLAIPPELAYGAGGAGQVIGPNAALIFEVELIGIPSQDKPADAKAEATPAAK
jgi:FKBP-type peptidyl-prolyl cis-trans isomerase